MPEDADRPAQRELPEDLPLTISDGRAFYRSRGHYVLTIERIARRIRHRRDRGRERFALILFGLLLIASLILQHFTTWSLVIPTGRGNVDVHVFGLAALLVWIVVYHLRLGKIRYSVVNRRRCFNCGMELLPFATDARGVGRCPECGTPYNIGWYEPPTG